MSPSPDGSISWRELLGETEARLARSDDAEVAEHASLDARRILAEAVGCSVAELALSLSQASTERSVAHLDDMVARRVAGEPLQYVLGSWSFRSLELMVDPRVLIPRPETEQVVEAALEELDRLGGRERPTTVADLGTGSGAIGLSIASERVRSEVWLTDASESALAVARANLAGIGRGGARVRVAHGHWFEALPSRLQGRLDLVVSNPPYVPTAADLPPSVTRWEPSSALFAGVDGTDDLRLLVRGAPRWLDDGGALVCELSPEQAPAMAELASRHFAEVHLGEDLTGRVRCIVGRSPRR